jgi:hypothetical protein
MNSLYGKFLQNSDEWCNTTMYSDMQRFAECLLEPQVVDCHIINDGSEDMSFFGSVDRRKADKNVEMSHRPTGFAVLEASKTYMYRFHYDVVKAFYANKAKLLYMDTDSLMYELETEDPFSDMLALNKSHNAQFDVTAHGFSEEYGKALGSLKYEGVHSKASAKAVASSNPQLSKDALRVLWKQPELIAEYVGVGSKAYAERHVYLDVVAFDELSKKSLDHKYLLEKLWTVSNDKVLNLDEDEWDMLAELPKKEVEYKKAKGVPGHVVKKQFTFEKYAALLVETNVPEVLVNFNQFRSYGHHIALINTSKRGLSWNNDKVFVTVSPDLFCRPLGHYANMAETQRRREAQR